MPAVELVNAYSRMSTRAGTTLNSMVGATWAGTMLGVDDQAANRWGSSIAPLIEAAKYDAAIATSGYITLAITEALGHKPFKKPEDVDLRSVISDLRNGPSVEEVYMRPVIEARSALANGASMPEALRRGERRAKNLAATDQQLARTNTAREMMTGEEGVVGYRRVLSGNESCGLCVVATTQRYHVGELMPIHPGCDCSVAPIIGTEDPGRTINQELLDATHQAVADRFGDDALDLGAQSAAYREQITVYGHGEYGPTLARAGDHQLTSSSASARRNPSLGGFSAADRDERGRRVQRPDWAKTLGASETPVQVTNGPWDPTIARNNGIPGPGVGYVDSQGRLVYVEYPAHTEGIDDQLRMDAAVRTRLDPILAELEATGVEGLEGPSMIMSVQGGSVSETQAALLYGQQVRVSANAGMGRVVHFHGEVHQQTQWHENGHIAANEINRRAEHDPHIFGVYKSKPTSNAPGMAWEDAQADDASHLQQAIWRSYSGDTGAREYDVLADSFGVTEYGATSRTEDWAESYRLAMFQHEHGYIATYRDSQGARQELSFEDMFPNRWNYYLELEGQAGVKFPFTP